MALQLAKCACGLGFKYSDYDKQEFCDICRMEQDPEFEERKRKLGFDEQKYLKESEAILESLDYDTHPEAGTPAMPTSPRKPGRPGRKKSLTTVSKITSKAIPPHTPASQIIPPQPSPSVTHKRAAGVEEIVFETSDIKITIKLSKK